MNQNEENDRLRAIFPAVLEALGNGSCCAPDASVEFMEGIPAEVKAEVDGLKRALEAACLFIELTPCDHDIYDNQLKAWGEFREAMDGIGRTADGKPVKTCAHPAPSKEEVTGDRTGEALPEIQDCNGDLLEQLGNAIEASGRRVAFGLRSQGHLPTIETMLSDGASWGEIGKRIGWTPATAQEWYEREEASEQQARPATCDACEHFTLVSDNGPDGEFIEACDHDAPGDEEQATVLVHDVSKGVSPNCPLRLRR